MMINIDSSIKKGGRKVGPIKTIFMEFLISKKDFEKTTQQNSMYQRIF